MKKLLLLAPIFLFACSNADLNEEGANLTKNETPSRQSIQLSILQAKAYANLFSTGFIVNDTQGDNKQATRTMASSDAIKTIHDVNYIVEDGDTLMYTVNYNDNKGFIILSGANNEFPIIAHSSIGDVYKPKLL